MNSEGNEWCHMTDFSNRFPGLPAELIASLTQEVDSDDPDAFAAQVLVQSVSDFPAASGGAITLLAGVTYVINGTVDIGTDYLVPALESRVRGEFLAIDTITYSGTGAAYRASGGAPVILKDVAITSVDEGITCAGGGSVDLNGVSITATKFGTFTDCPQVVIHRSQGLDLDNGIELVTAAFGNIFAITLSALTQAAGATGTLLDLGTSSWAIFRLDNVRLVSVVGGTDISGLVSSGNLLSTVGRGQVFGSFINGSGTHLANIDPDDTLWNFFNTDGVRDSTVIGTATMSGNVTSTATTTTDLFVKVAGTTATGFVRKFDDDSSTSNRLRYVGQPDITVRVEAVLELTKSGSAVVYAVQIFKNGAATGQAFDVSVSNSSPGSIAISAFSDAVTNDFYEVYVANTAGIEAVTATELQLTVTKV